MMTITRAHLAEAVYKEIGFSHVESADLVDAVLEEIIGALEKEDTVKLSSFGTFSVRHKKARMGRNPKTKEEIPITPRKVVSFHASNILVKRMNAGGDTSGNSDSGSTPAGGSMPGSGYTSGYRPEDY